MIIDEIRQDILRAIHQYTKNYNLYESIPMERKSDILIIRRLLKKEDPILICRCVNHYIESIALPFISFLTFFDVNNFVALIRKVLQQSKYQEVNLLRTLLEEKEDAIEKLRQSPRNLSDEVKLLQNETRYLYGALACLDSKINELENDKKKALQRAQAAEQELKALRLTCAQQLKGGQQMNSKLTECIVNLTEECPQTVLTCKN